MKAIEINENLSIKDINVVFEDEDPIIGGVAVAVTYVSCKCLSHCIEIDALINVTAVNYKNYIIRDLTTTDYTPAEAIYEVSNNEEDIFMHVYNFVRDYERKHSSI